MAYIQHISKKKIKFINKLIIIKEKRKEKKLYIINWDKLSKKDFIKWENRMELLLNTMAKDTNKIN